MDQATSGAYYSIIVLGSGFVRDTGVQNISGQKSFYSTTTFYSGLNLTGDFVPSGEIAGNLIPKTDNLYNLGSSSKEWRNIYCDGTGWFDTLVVDENLTIATGLSVGGSTVVSGNLSVASNSSVQGVFGVLGATTISGALGVTGNLTVTGDFLPKNIATNLLPKTNNLYDLGSLANQFKDAYFDGTVQTDTLLVDQNASVVGDLTVNRLFVSGTGIPASTGAAGSFGQFTIGSGHLFICTGANAWARTHLTGWT